MCSNTGSSMKNETHKGSRNGKRRGSNRLLLWWLMMCMIVMLLGMSNLWQTLRFSKLIDEVRDVGVDCMEQGGRKIMLEPCGDSELWFVSTASSESVHPALERIMRQSDRVGFCVVVVGLSDRMNETSWLDLQEEFTPRMRFLSRSAQEDLPFAIVKYLPWNHLARKSIGYLYAMASGAKAIFDFDVNLHDEIYLLEDIFPTGNHSDMSMVSPMDQLLNSMILHDYSHIHPTSHHVMFNPYPFFRPERDEIKDDETDYSLGFLWPRGFPPQYIHKPSTQPYHKNTTRTTSSKTSPQDLAMVQSLLDKDPDLDAIAQIKLTNDLHQVDYVRQHSILVPPKNALTPTHANALLVRPPAFFSLLLPLTQQTTLPNHHEDNLATTSTTTTTNNHIDTWRGYITSRLLHETSLQIGYSSPLLSRQRGVRLTVDHDNATEPKNMHLDGDEQTRGYDDLDVLLHALTNWKTTTTTSSNRRKSMDGEMYLELISYLVQRQVLGNNDLHLAQAWVSDLDQFIGYTWPPSRQIHDNDKNHNNYQTKASFMKSNYPQHPHPNALFPPVRQTPFALSMKKEANNNTNHSSLPLRNQDPRIAREWGRDQAYINLQVGQPFRGGVVPLRRFRMVPQRGRVLAVYSGPTFDSQGNLETLRDKMSLCNDLCLATGDCDAWVLVGIRNLPREWMRRTKDRFRETECTLFTNEDRDGPMALESYQADKADLGTVTGFMQRGATVLTPKVHVPVKDQNSDSEFVASSRRLEAMTIENNGNDEQDYDISQRYLYIMHFHHFIVRQAFDILMNVALPGYLPPELFDMVVITSRQVDLFPHYNDTSKRGRSLMNPFRPMDDVSLRGSNSHMSLPISKARFPGYKGYLVVNDDAVMQLWTLAQDTNTWLGDVPWGTFAMRDRSQPMPTIKRKGLFRGKRYPYGAYKWKWWNKDSGSAAQPPPRLKMSNFEAALYALNEFCSMMDMRAMVQADFRLQELCVNREHEYLTPFVHGKSDIYFVPNNELGDNLARVLVLLGEHDVFHEVSYALAYNWVVPDEKLLALPYCDGEEHVINGKIIHKSKLNDSIFFTPYFDLESDNPGRHLNCPGRHPLKFSYEESLDYWREEVARDCPACPGIGPRDKFVPFWTILR